MNRAPDITDLMADRMATTPTPKEALRTAAIDALGEWAYLEAADSPGYQLLEAMKWVQENPEEFWDEFAEPMLYALEDKFRRKG